MLQNLKFVLYTLFINEYIDIDQMYLYTSLPHFDLPFWICTQKSKKLRPMEVPNTIKRLSIIFTPNSSLAVYSS